MRVGVLEKSSKISQNLQGRPRVGGPFIVKLQPVIAYKRLLGQLYQKKTPTRRRRDSVNFDKNYEHDY